MEYGNTCCVVKDLRNDRLLGGYGTDRWSMEVNVGVKSRTSECLITGLADNIQGDGWVLLML